jgi:cytochrome c-type biogenesis protein CcmH/NrfF
MLILQKISVLVLIILLFLPILVNGTVIDESHPNSDDDEDDNDNIGDD